MKPGVERTAFVALSALLLAPVVAQGLWRPLSHFLGASGDAGAITVAALVIAGAIVLVERLRPDRAPWLSAAAGGLVAAGASIGWSLGASGLVALGGVATAITLLVRWLAPRLPAALDGLAGRHKLLTTLYVAPALLAIVTTARVSIFMGDPTRVDRQAIPGQDFMATHSCLTAYVNAAALGRRGTDILYDARWWLGSHGQPLPAGVENPYRPFLLDDYAYPPPFLLVMAPLAPLEGDFPAQRALWFGLNAILLAIGLWIVARWIEGPGDHRVLLLSPIFFGSLPVVATLQVGNFQVAVVVISVLAMVAFDRDRPVVGGALLAFAILSKISPGVLAIVLLAQRRWRDAAWTAGFGALFVALSLLHTGVDPIRSFLTYALPRISSGAAFAFMDDTPFNILTNMSPFGLPFKLQLLGLHAGDPWALGRHVSRGYTLALLVVAIVAARRPGADRRARALTWMSLLVLGSLQSPFAPGYVTIGLLWALTLLAVEVRRLRGAVALLVPWIVLAVLLPVSSLSVLAANSVLQSALAAGIPVWLIARAALRPGARRHP